MDVKISKSTAEWIIDIIRDLKDNCYLLYGENDNDVLDDWDIDHFDMEENKLAQLSDILNEVRPT